jgi:hypothetical protein
LTGSPRPLYSAGFVTPAVPADVRKAPVAELVDALDSKSSSARSAGSIPARGTIRASALVRQCSLSPIITGQGRISAYAVVRPFLLVSGQLRRVWVIEAKNLRLCRTEIEIASRLVEYRGRMNRHRNGRETPDKMLRHIRRVEFMRDNAKALLSRLKLDAPPDVHGLLVVDAPQPMNFFAAGQLPDGQTVILDAIDAFQF